MVLDKIMPERLAELFKMKKLTGPQGQRIPKHVAINIAGNIKWAKAKNLTDEDGYRKGFSNIIDAVNWQIERKIPIMTVFLMPENMKKSEQFPGYLDEMTRFFDRISKEQLFHANQVKISVLGKWYDLPGSAVEKIKTAQAETRDYDRFFLNFCINYDGQNEIVDSVKLLVRMAREGKISEKDVNKASIKENLYSSFFLPVDLYIVFLRKTLEGHLLWDSQHAHIYFSDKYWPEADMALLDKALESYQQ